MIKGSSVTRKVIVSGLTGLIIFVLLLALLLTWPIQTGERDGSDGFPGGLFYGLLFILATFFSTFVSGALSVYLTFGDTSYSREAINHSFYSGCITAIPLLLYCAATGISSPGIFPGCLVATLISVLPSVIGGSIVFIVLSSVKSKKAKGP